MKYLIGKNLSNENVLHLYKGDIEYLQFRKLIEYEENIEHCYTLKPLDFKAGENLEREYKEICKALKLDTKNIYRPKQTHSTNVKKVEFQGIHDKEFENVDGLITDKTDKILSLTFADCICLYFYDPVKNVIGCIHSGWRGTYNEISKIAVEALKREYNVNTKDLICVIAPSIRECCFEVDEDVKTMFYEKFKAAEEIGKAIKKSKNNSKYYIDTVLINKVILKREGLREENIIDSKICTKCNSDNLHSYREYKEKSGRNTGLIALR